MTTEQIGKAIRELKYGKSFTVGTEGERRMALVLAKGFAKRIVTKKAKAGGFQIIALE
jgi:hypothetical protein